LSTEIGLPDVGLEAYGIIRRPTRGGGIDRKTVRKTAATINENNEMANREKTNAMKTSGKFQKHAI